MRAIATAAPTPPKIQKLRPRVIFLSADRSERSLVKAPRGDSLEDSSAETAGAGRRARPASSSPRARASAAWDKSAAEAGLFSGFFAMQDMTNARTASGMEAGRAGGASLICAMAMATCDSPLKGRLPASAS